MQERHPNLDVWLLVEDKTEPTRKRIRIALPMCANTATGTGLSVAPYSTDYICLVACKTNAQCLFHPTDLWFSSVSQPRSKVLMVWVLQLNDGTLTSSFSSTQKQPSSRNWWRWSQEAKNSVIVQCCRKQWISAAAPAAHPASSAGRRHSLVSDVGHLIDLVDP